MSTRSISRRGDSEATFGALALATLLAGTLLACGGGSGPAAPGSGSGSSPGGVQGATGSAAPLATITPGGTAVDACSLLTTEEVQAKAGETVSKTEKGNSSCTWWLGNAETGWIKLVVWPNGRGTFEAMAPSGQAVAGLGDKAFSDGDTLVALKGDTMLQLGSETLLSKADPDVFTRPLMEAALARL